RQNTRPRNKNQRIIRGSPFGGEVAFLNKLNRANLSRNQIKKINLPRAQALLSCPALKRHLNCRAPKHKKKQRCALKRKKYKESRLFKALFRTILRVVPKFWRFPLLRPIDSTRGRAPFDRIYGRSVRDFLQIPFHLQERAHEIKEQRILSAIASARAPGLLQPHAQSARHSRHWL
ncbi:MAG: hypothetical protein IKC51_05655, partial [Myxococcaceae bacterium]|nr:hypothetical protein [Myxococcaceae bacterium]